MRLLLKYATFVVVLLLLSTSIYAQDPKGEEETKPADETKVEQHSHTSSPTFWETYLPLFAANRDQRLLSYLEKDKFHEFHDLIWDRSFEISENVNMKMVAIATFKAVVQHDYRFLTAMSLAGRNNLNAVDELGRSQLVIATVFGDDWVVKLFLDADGVNPNVESPNKMKIGVGFLSPLMASAASEHDLFVALVQIYDHGAPDISTDKIINRYAKVDLNKLKEIQHVNYRAHRHQNIENMLLSHPNIDLNFEIRGTYPDPTSTAFTHLERKIQLKAQQVAYEKAQQEALIKDLQQALQEPQEEAVQKKLKEMLEKLQLKTQKNDEPENKYDLGRLTILKIGLPGEIKPLHIINEYARHLLVEEFEPQNETNYDPREFEVVTEYKIAADQGVREEFLNLASIIYDKKQLKRWIELLEQYKFDGPVLAEAFEHIFKKYEKAMTRWDSFLGEFGIKPAPSIRPEALKFFLETTTLPREAKSKIGKNEKILPANQLVFREVYSITAMNMAMSYEYVVSKDLFEVSKPYLTDHALKNIQIVVAARTGNLTEFEEVYPNGTLLIEAKEVALHQAIIKEQLYIINELAEDKHLQHAVGEEFTRVVGEYVRGGKVNFEVLRVLRPHLHEKIIAENIDLLSEKDRGAAENRDVERLLYGTDMTQGLAHDYMEKEAANVTKKQIIDYFEGLSKEQLKVMNAVLSQLGIAQEPNHNEFDNNPKAKKFYQWWYLTHINGEPGSKIKSSFYKALCAEILRDFKNVIKKISLFNLVMERAASNDILLLGTPPAPKNEVDLSLEASIRNNKPIDYTRLIQLTSEGENLFLPYRGDDAKGKVSMSRLSKILDMYEYRLDKGWDVPESKSFLVDLILISFENYPNPIKSDMRFDELLRIESLDIGFISKAKEYDENGFRKHNFSKRAQIFYNYIINDASILLHSEVTLAAFIYSTRQMSKEQIEGCLSAIAKLPQSDEKLKIYNYYSNEKNTNTYNRTLINNAINAGVDIKYLVEAFQNGADFTVEKDNFEGHSNVTGNPKKVYLSNHNINIVLQSTLSENDLNNTRKTLRFLITDPDGPILQPSDLLKEVFLDNFIGYMHKFGFTAEETLEFISRIFAKQYNDKPSLRPSWAEVNKKIQLVYENSEPKPTESVEPAAQQNPQDKDIIVRASRWFHNAMKIAISWAKIADDFIRPPTRGKATVKTSTTEPKLKSSTNYAGTDGNNSYIVVTKEHVEDNEKFIADVRSGNSEAILQEKNNKNISPQTRRRALSQAIAQYKFEIIPLLIDSEELKELAVQELERMAVYYRLNSSPLDLQMLVVLRGCVDKKSVKEILDNHSLIHPDARFALTSELAPQIVTIEKARKFIVENAQEYSEKQIRIFVYEILSNGIKEPVWSDINDQLNIESDQNLSEIEKDPVAKKYYQEGALVHYMTEIGSGWKNILILALWEEILDDFRSRIKDQQKLKEFYRQATSIKYGILIFGSDPKIEFMKSYMFLDDPAMFKNLLKTNVFEPEIYLQAFESLISGPRANSPERQQMLVILLQTVQFEPGVLDAAVLKNAAAVPDHINEQMMKGADPYLSDKTKANLKYLYAVLADDAKTASEMFPDKNITPEIKEAAMRQAVWDGKLNVVIELSSDPLMRLVINTAFSDGLMLGLSENDKFVGELIKSDVLDVEIVKAALQKNKNISQKVHQVLDQYVKSFTLQTPDWITKHYGTIDLLKYMTEIEKSKEVVNPKDATDIDSKKMVFDDLTGALQIKDIWNSEIPKDKLLLQAMAFTHYNGNPENEGDPITAYKRILVEELYTMMLTNYPVEIAAYEKINGPRSFKKIFQRGTAQHILLFGIPGQSPTVAKTMLRGVANYVKKLLVPEKQRPAKIDPTTMSPEEVLARTINDFKVDSRNLSSPEKQRIEQIANTIASKDFSSRKYMIFSLAQAAKSVPGSAGHFFGSVAIFQLWKAAHDPTVSEGEFWEALKGMPKEFSIFTVGATTATFAFDMTFVFKDMLAFKLMQQLGPKAIAHIEQMKMARQVLFGTTSVRTYIKGQFGMIAGTMLMMAVMNPEMTLDEMVRQTAYTTASFIIADLIVKRIAVKATLTLALKLVRRGYEIGKWIYRGVKCGTIAGVVISGIEMIIAVPITNYFNKIQKNSEVSAAMYESLFRLDFWLKGQPIPQMRFQDACLYETDYNKRGSCYARMAISSMQLLAAQMAYYPLQEVNQKFLQKQADINKSYSELDQLKEEDRTPSGYGLGIPVIEDQFTPARFTAYNNESKNLWYKYPSSTKETFDEIRSEIDSDYKNAFGLFLIDLEFKKCHPGLSDEECGIEIIEQMKERSEVLARVMGPKLIDGWKERQDRIWNTCLGTRTNKKYVFGIKGIDNNFIDLDVRDLNQWSETMMYFYARFKSIQIDSNDLERNTVKFIFLNQILTMVSHELVNGSLAPLTLDQNKDKYDKGMILHSYWPSHKGFGDWGIIYSLKTDPNGVMFRGGQKGELLPVPPMPKLVFGWGEPGLAQNQKAINDYQKIIRHNEAVQNYNDMQRTLENAKKYKAESFTKNTLSYVLPSKSATFLPNKFTKLGRAKERLLMKLGHYYVCTWSRKVRKDFLQSYLADGREFEDSKTYQNQENTYVEKMGPEKKYNNGNYRIPSPEEWYAYQDKQQEQFELEVPLMFLQTFKQVDLSNQLLLEFDGVTGVTPNILSKYGSYTTCENPTAPIS